MKTAALGIGMAAGAALAVTIINSLYPDVPRRMMRDGKRLWKKSKRACQLGM
ncbi:MAG: hypothetical protein Q4C04_00005 [Clostridia bacterium]|nr:hypothetical protein [Clostridia bacterium]